MYQDVFVMFRVKLVEEYYEAIFLTLSDSI